MQTFPAVRFYRDTLGLRFLFTAPPHLAFFDCDGVRLLIDLPGDKEFDYRGSVLYFAVDDIRVVHQTLVSRGVAFRREPHLIARLPDREVWMAFFERHGREYAGADVGTTNLTRFQSRR